MVEWTPHVAGNTLIAAWLAVEAAARVIRVKTRRAGVDDRGAGLVLWGCYIVAALALNVEGSPLLVLPRIVEHIGIAAAGGGLAIRAALLFAPLRPPAGGAERETRTLRDSRASRFSNLAFWMGVTGASGNLIAMLTVMVAISAATAVALSSRVRGDWDTRPR